MNELNQLKNKVNDICKDLSEKGEESFFVTVNIEQTTCFVMGSDIGLKWLDSQSMMIQDFFRYVSGLRLRSGASSKESLKKESQNLDKTFDEEANLGSIKEEVIDPLTEVVVLDCLETVSGTVKNTVSEQTGTEGSISPATKQQIIEWSFEETKDFYEQVKKHGYGNWNIIKEDLNTSRTVDQLKERWKFMIKDQTLMSEFNFGKIKKSLVKPEDSNVNKGLVQAKTKATTLKCSVKHGEDSDVTNVNEGAVKDKTKATTLKCSVKHGEDSDITDVNEGAVKDKTKATSLKCSVKHGEDSDVTDVNGGAVEDEMKAKTLSIANEFKDKESVLQKENKTAQNVTIASNLNQEVVSPISVSSVSLPVSESTNSLKSLAKTTNSPVTTTTPSSENRANKRKENKELRVQVNSSNNKDANTEKSTENIKNTAHMAISTNDNTQHASTRPRRTPKPKKLFNMECYVKLENINKMNVADLIYGGTTNEPKLNLLENRHIKKESEEKSNLSLLSQMSKSVTRETKEAMGNSQEREDINEEEDLDADIRSVEIDPTFLVQSEQFSNESSENDVIEESVFEEIPKKKLKSTRNSKDEGKVIDKKMLLENHKNNIRSRIKRARKREDSHIPCPTCDLMFSTSKGFKRHLRVCQVVKCPQCDKQFKSMEEFEGHVEVHKGEELHGYQCIYCDMQFLLTSQLRKHEKTHYEFKYKYQCQLCPKSYNSGTSLRQHIREGHKESRICCLVCGKFCDSEFDYNQHMSGHHIHRKKMSTFSCKKCGKTFEQLYHLKRHNRYFHKAIGERICKLCLKICKDKEEYQEHIKEHEWDKPNMCSFCRVPFPSKEQLEEHIRDTHDKGVRYMCEVCGFQASCALDMKYHKYEHDDSMPHVCEVCGKGFALKSKLKSHMINHQEEMPYVCEVCGKKFKRRSTLRSHSFVHSEGKKCQFCEKVFRSIGGCDYHIVRVHSHLVNVDNYKRNLVKCEECNKFFPSKYTHDQHQIKHLKEKSWMCDLCGKKFKTQAQLEKHKPNHELVKPFYCQCCECAFITQSRLDAHVKTEKHKENVKRSEDPLAQKVNVQQEGVIQQGILNQHGGFQQQEMLQQMGNLPQQGIQQPMIKAKKVKKTVAVLQKPRRSAAVTKSVNDNVGQEFIAINKDLDLETSATVYDYPEKTIIIIGSDNISGDMEYEMQGEIEYIQEGDKLIPTINGSEIQIVDEGMQPVPVHMVQNQVNC
ncbi:KRAB [Mytilus coruscus]|uniref:KRAB n=1 Tax=Mytilus coruscus TaxID=42192 RepID=A0A6J8BWB3_MYTCO|nr:KRAB [Mytilus coruscus]